jgi:hypothetical protein
MIAYLFKRERGRAIRDTAELLRFVFDLRARYGWKTLPEVMAMVEV